MAEKEYYLVRSTSDRGGHYRSGKYWTTVPTSVSAEEVTELMWADPRLIIELDVKTVQPVIEKAFKPKPKPKPKSSRKSKRGKRGKK